MRCNCGKLLKAIDAYIAKVDSGLQDELASAGFVDAGNTMDAIRALEDDVAAALVEETQTVTTAAGKAVDLQTFANEIWPGVQLDDQLAAQLTEIFKTRLVELMPGLIESYLKRTDNQLTISQVSKATTDWIGKWSAQLGDLMQLNSHSQIETILAEGLKNGSSIAEFTQAILDSGIRNEYYRARTVSVTEVLRAHNVAQQEAFMQSPAVAQKRWRHTGGHRITPRENHIAMDGQTVGKAERFTMQGLDGNTYFPMYPVDPVLPASESISCHCICEPVVDEQILGLSLEERQALQQQAIKEMDEDWEMELDAQNRARAGIE